MKRKNILLLMGLALFFSSLIGEVVVRVSGISDYPIYTTDSEIGYIPAPNQNGSFLNKNDWYYNDLSMGVPEDFSKSLVNNILLIGDSIVNGGNPSRQIDRLGPILQEYVSGKVWPVSAGSWALINEMRWMERHPSVVGQMSTVVIVSNSADFGRPSVWQSDTVTPRYRSTSALWYAIRRYALAPSEQPLPADLADPDRDWTKEYKMQLANFVKKNDTRLIVVLYPDLLEFENATLRQSRLLSRKNDFSDLNKVEIVDVASDSRWSHKDLYRDSIHPSVQGTRVLAAIIADRIRAQP